MRRLVTVRGLRFVATIGLLANLLPSGTTAGATEREDLLCSRDEVLRLVRNELRRRSHYAELDVASIREFSTADPNLVSCNALVRIPERTATETRQLSATRIVDQAYEVNVLRRRLTVRLGP